MTEPTPSQPQPAPDFEAARWIAERGLYYDAHIQDGEDACCTNRDIIETDDARTDFLIKNGSALASAHLAALAELAASREECGRLRAQLRVHEAEACLIDAERYMTYCDIKNAQEELKEALANLAEWQAIEDNEEEQQP